MTSRLRVLELFAGIGGCSAALEGSSDVVAAVDVNAKALAVYSRNFPHSACVRTIESLPDTWFQQWDADLWWLSPPCQPHTVRGRQKDVDDPRAAGFSRVVAVLPRIRPRYVALENVPGFETSRARVKLLEVLDSAGYSVRETMLCPTQLGLPNRRRRYYLVAARQRLLPWSRLDPDPPRCLSVRDVLELETTPDLEVSPQLMAHYSGAVHVVDANDPRAIACCFTSAYGKSIACSGSFVKVDHRFRRFSPREILRLFRFPEPFELPPDEPRRWWPLVGNSLSVAAVRHVLSAIPELAQLGERKERTVKAMHYPNEVPPPP